MINLEGLENSYNRRAQKDIISEYDIINLSKDKYLFEKYKYKEEYEAARDVINLKIIENEAHIKTLFEERKTKISNAKNKYKLYLAELVDVKKLDIKEVRQQHNLIVGKIQANYQRVSKEYKLAIKNNVDYASQAAKEFEEAYAIYYEQESTKLKTNLEEKCLNIAATFEVNEKNLLNKFEEEVCKVNDEYLGVVRKRELDEQLQKTFDPSKITELKQQILALNKAKVEKIARLAENRKYHQDIKELHKERIKQEANNISRVLGVKKEYLEAKANSNNKIKKIKEESNKYYQSLDENNKKIYKNYQAYVRQDFKAIRRRNLDEKERRLFKRVNPAYIYILPAFFGAMFFTLLPFVFMLVTAFFKLDLSTVSNSRFVGFNNFINIFTRDIEFQKSLRNTVVYSFTTIILLSVITIGMAAWLAKNTKIHNIAQTMIFTPHIASLVAISILWIAMLNPTGLINQFLAFFGIKGPGWLIQENTSLVAVSFVTVWKDIGYYVLIIISGLQAIPSYVYEAAKLDKASKSKTFFKLTMPLLAPTLSFVFVTKFINSFKVFAPIEIMTNGGPMGSSMVLSYWIYKVGRIGYNYGNAMAGAIVLTVIIAFCTFINYRYFKKQVTY